MVNLAYDELGDSLMQNSVLLSFLLTIIAGMSTMIGTIFIFTKKSNKILACTMSFAAGVMISVSIVDLIPESIYYFKNIYQLQIIPFICLFFIVLGIFLSIILDKWIKKINASNNTLYKVGIMSLFSLILHNIPEGIITFLTSSIDMKLGFTLTMAIAIHNIPEGISISVPIYYATKNRKKAIFYTLVSAFSEPLGAFLAFLFIAKYINFTLLGILLSLTAGVMLYISFYELLPIAFHYSHKGRTFFCFLIGLLLMMLKMFI